MKSCPSCGASAEDGARFCLECGHAFEDAPLADDPWSGRLVAGRYRLMDKLGEGGMGEVFRAEQLPMGRLVAVKTLRQSLADDSRAVERFKREAQAASQLVHPNTITVHDFGQDQDGTLFIAMELLSGEGLDGVLDREGPLPPERVVHILSQVCGSLAEAHGRGLIHRDLKPENIMLSRIGDQPDFVKVLDFGIAKVTQSSRGERLETLTSAGAIFGTPQYMAPEQIRGDDIDARADVYALGVVLYQMIAGQLPFAASTVMEMLTKHLSAQPAPIARGVSSESDEAYARLEAVALRALSKDPAQRQPTARAFLEDLMAAMPHVALNPLTGLMPQAATAAPAPVQLPAPATESARPGSAGRVVFFAALLAALAGAAFFFLRVNPPPAGGDAAPAVLAQAADEGGDGEGGDGEGAPAGEQAAGGEAAGGDAAGGEAAGGDAAGEQAAGDGDAAAGDGDAADPPPADDKPMTDDEAKAAAAEAAAEEKAARDAAKAAQAEEKAKAAEEKAKGAEEKKKSAEAAKAAAEAEKQAAEMAKKAAEAEKLQAQEAAAQAKAAAAQAAADKAAAEAEAEKARKQREAIEAQRAAAEAAKNKAEAEAAQAKAEAEALKAQLQQIEDEKAAAAAKVEEQRLKAEEAKAKAQAAKKKQRPKVTFGAIKVTGPAGEKVMVNNRMRGKLPMSQPIKLKAGRYTVRVGGQTRTVNVTGGGTASVRF